MNNYSITAILLGLAVASFANSADAQAAVKPAKKDLAELQGRWETIARPGSVC